jgi:hypothetical protein
MIAICLVFGVVALISFTTALIIDTVTYDDTISDILNILGWACLLAHLILSFIGRCN